ncbi:hypothetical protein F441_08069 [Phytophthora nicotianae CJ01A1]|uniref:RXLR phytopathogen effector protein WY-domain domain-containing protein n=4 Tax=Phytophthora nicotianae TaxID=4792 RepID=V9F8C9_PHYNI|nr:hypothetical protein F443_08095 [Phytophthora nicotianae P1569]ETL41091.1 hypothetical protein L916_07851 [Phytophthora nicotianae]ETL94254.1 hypothetical protein L917_07744 [Phytophthora nicotianae]ETO76460.1 hypothetical protein F444_08144 [Phytophthora nicotianae P1976]ETP17538.1 hypothetical protein F441_08069 [Phytophthora nicotianae CJ01A1]
MQKLGEGVLNPDKQSKVNTLFKSLKVNQVNSDLLFSSGRFDEWTQAVLKIYKNRQWPAEEAMFTMSSPL